MQKFLFLLFSILIIGCCNKPNYLKNGLTKKVSKITEYTIDIKRDSLNNIISDTLSITDEKFNSDDQVIKRTQNYIFDNEIIKTDYIYNEEKKIKKEIINLSREKSEIIIDYFYEDTLLVKTSSISEIDDYRFKRIGKFKYSDTGKKQESLEYIYFDKVSNDTVAHTIQIRKYNKQKLETESKNIDFLYPVRNRLAKYKYKCGLLENMKEFDYKDSLISNITYKYKFDKYKNWTKREAYENDKIDYLKIRDLKYN